MNTWSGHIFMAMTCKMLFKMFWAMVPYLFSVSLISRPNMALHAITVIKTANCPNNTNVYSIILIY